MVTSTRSPRRAAIAYADRKPSTVEGFRAALRGAVQTLEEFPEVGVRIADTEFHRQSLGPYPYSVIYQILPSSVLIVGVPHNHQSAKTWLKRLSRP